MRGTVAKELRRQNPGTVPVKGGGGTTHPRQPAREVSAYRRAKRAYIRSRRHA